MHISNTAASPNISIDVKITYPESKEFSAINLPLDPNTKIIDLATQLRSELGKFDRGNSNRYSDPAFQKLIFRSTTHLFVWMIRSFSSSTADHPTTRNRAMVYAFLRKFFFFSNYILCANLCTPQLHIYVPT